MVGVGNFTVNVIQNKIIWKYDWRYRPPIVNSLVVGGHRIRTRSPISGLSIFLTLLPLQGMVLKGGVEFPLMLQGSWFVGSTEGDNQGIGGVG